MLNNTSVTNTSKLQKDLYLYLANISMTLSMSIVTSKLLCNRDKTFAGFVLLMLPSKYLGDYPTFAYFFLWSTRDY